jgi:peptidoglycan hydrolase-like protein with peptidoglycan-binding domain
MPFDSTTQAAQRALNRWWEVTPKLVEDGVFGANTARGVRQFQKRVGLPQTGQLDQATLNRLGVANGGAGAGIKFGGNVGASAGIRTGGASGGGSGQDSALVMIADAAGKLISVPFGTPIRIVDAAGKIIVSTAGAAVDMAKAAGTSLVLSVDAAGNRVARIGGSLEEILKAYAAPFGAMFGLSLPVVGLAAAVLLVLMLKSRSQ